MADTLSESHTEQEVSGQVLLWAIVAMSFSNMVQPSQPLGMGLTLFQSEDRQQGLIDTGLSSPVICLMDSSLQLAAMLWRLWRRLCGDIASPTKPSPDGGAICSVPNDERKDVAVRLISFVLAVLPQAIKIFGMRGIAATQAIAAVLLFTAVVQILSASTTEMCRHEGQAIEDWLARDSFMKDLIKVTVMVAHGALYTFAWLEVAKTLSVPRTHTSEVVLYVIMDIGVIACLISMMLVIPWAARVYHMRLLRLWPYRLSPIWASFALWHVMAYPGFLLSIDDRKKQGLGYPPGAGPIMAGVIPPVALAALVSYGVAWALSGVVSLLLADRHASQQAPALASDAGQVQSLDMTESHPHLYDSDHPRPEDAATPMALRSAYTTQQPIMLPTIAGNVDHSDTQHHVGTGLSPAAQQATTTLTDSPERGRGDGETDDKMDHMPALFLVTLSIFFEVNLGRETVPSNHTHDRSNSKDVALRSFTEGRPKLARTFEERPAFGKWVVYSVFFKKFRASVPATLLHAWRGEDINDQPKTFKACVRCFVYNLALAAIYFGLLMIGFVLLTISNVFDWPSREKIMVRMGKGLLWTSFALFNLTTAVVYFTVAYDGTGTANPGWTNVFGR